MHFDQADPDEQPTSEPSSTDEGNDFYSQVCGAETTVPTSSSDEYDAPAQSSGTSSRQKINDNEQPLITEKLRKRLQERVDELRSATFVVDDSAILENTITTVESLLKDLRQSSSLENGLPLRQSPAKKKLKVTEVDYHKVKHKTLPKRRRHSKRRKDRGVVVDLTRAEGNSKDSAV